MTKQQERAVDPSPARFRVFQTTIAPKGQEYARPGLQIIRATQVYFTINRSSADLPEPSASLNQSG